MSRFYSHELEEGIRILYFQSDMKKYPEGLKKITRAVNEGEPDSYYILARCYAWEEGGLDSNMEKARALSREGILKGSDLCVLGAVRFHGLTGDIKDAMHGSLEDAFHGCLRQAQAGNPMAQYAVANFYFWQDISGLQKPGSQTEYDKFEKENTLEALKWFNLAARQGCIPAFRNHYISLLNGTNGAPRDMNAAMRFVEETKMYVEIPQDLYYDFAIQYGKLHQPMDENRWLEAGVNKGDGSCANSLGLKYLNGEGVEKSQSEAFRLFCRSADLGEEYGEYNLGRCYYYGCSTPVDNERAFCCFDRAAQKGVDAAQGLLAECYYYGYGTEVDYEKCFYWATRAMKKGIKSSYYYLGKCHLYGQGTPENPVKAKEYLDQSAQKGDADAMYLLGQIYDKALGVPEDIGQAMAYYRQAVEAGSKKAQDALTNFKKTFTGKWKRR